MRRRCREVAVREYASGVQVNRYLEVYELAVKARRRASEATPGKLAVGICVTDLEGQRISFPRALGRTLGKLLSVLFFGLGFLMAGWTARKQALHDLLAGTLVVQRARVASEQPAADPAAAGAAARMSGRAPQKATPRDPEG